jgi:hypothetical protein
VEGPAPRLARLTAQQRRKRLKAEQNCRPIANCEVAQPVKWIPVTTSIRSRTMSRRSSLNEPTRSLRSPSEWNPAMSFRAEVLSEFESPHAAESESADKLSNSFFHCPWGCGLSRKQKEERNSSQHEGDGTRLGCGHGGERPGDEEPRRGDGGRWDAHASQSVQRPSVVTYQRSCRGGGEEPVDEVTRTVD